MNAGIVKSRYKKSELDKAINQYREVVLPAITTHEGARSAFLFVNRDTGESLSIAIYENEGSAKSFAPKAEKLIASFEKFSAGDTKPKREPFEIAASTQNEARAVIERGMKAFNAHDMEAIARNVAPGGEYHAPGDIKLKGSQQIKEYNQNFVTAFPDARVEAKNIFTQGNQVVVEGVFTGTHNGTLKTPMGDVPATGNKVSGEYIQVFDVDRGLVKKVHMIYDQVQLMTQLGMAPAPPQQATKSSR